MNFRGKIAVLIRCHYGINHNYYGNKEEKYRFFISGVWCNKDVNEYHGVKIDMKEKYKVSKESELLCSLNTILSDEHSIYECDTKQDIEHDSEHDGDNKCVTRKPICLYDDELNSDDEHNSDDNSKIISKISLSDVLDVINSKKDIKSLEMTEMIRLKHSDVNLDEL